MDINELEKILRNSKLPEIATPLHKQILESFILKEEPVKIISDRQDNRPIVMFDLIMPCPAFSSDDLLNNNFNSTSYVSCY
ncbi:MAG: hypothetical protein US42_C0018G0011 [Candidatus Magasanikbacteria bacterium GW2011_GWC2_37_14]|uniref:Uncharacterized protein n=1 Tax=Candidatus Magasanikbacteria bacterium GW2011_GWC2_37_14 TaxID=1619046 RepID=A0A0G0GAD3_9BACT|nr:MAG: hypothetical protein US42_C0018G0011 [Candidatus Magasanikbacteria bacterium GW2011_GWC2_37_14]